MARLEIRGLEKKFDQTAVLHNIDLEVPDGELCVFVGPSGCGKSTLLRCTAGLEPISDGELRIGGRDIGSLPPAQRGVAMVFQSYALYPHMSVAENISFGLRMHGLERAEIDRKVRDVAQVLGLQDLLKRKPRTLSGGQRQRVAIGRALVREPQLFLLDEPLSNLDAALRVQMRVEIARLHREIGATMVYVTHDQVESMTLADRIVVLNEGRIEQIGSPLELYNNPRNLFVAGFIGSPKMNFISATVIDGDVDLVELALPGGGSVGLPFDGSALEAGVPVTLGIRPEHLADHAVGTSRLPADVTAVEHLGGESHVYARLVSGGEVSLRVPGTSALAIGDHTVLGFDAEAAHLFDSAGQALPRLPSAFG